MLFPRARNDLRDGPVREAPGVGRVGRPREEVLSGRGDHQRKQCKPQELTGISYARRIKRQRGVRRQAVFLANVIPSQTMKEVGVDVTGLSRRADHRDRVVKDACDVA
jgi:hypothetical protein